MYVRKLIMKIVFTSIAFRFFDSNTKVGGGEISNRDLIYSLSDNNEVYIISAYGGGGWNVNKDGVVSFEIAALLKRYLISNDLSVVLSKLLYKMIAYFKIKKIKPDFLLGGTYSAYVVSKYKNYNRNCRAGFFIRAFENFKFNNKLKDVVKKNIYGNYGVDVLKNLDFIIVNSQFMKKKCLDYGLSECILNVVYPGISIENESKGEKIKSNKIKMISTRSDKGFDIFYELSKAFPDYEFEVAGDSSVKNKKKLTKNLTILGWLNDPKSFIEESDVFLVPSLVEETFGRVSVESILTGVTTIVSNAGGLPETVNNNKNFIVESSDVNDWIKKLKLVLDVDNSVFIKKEFSNVKEYGGRFRKCEQIKMWKNIIKKESSYLKGVK